MSANVVRSSTTGVVRRKCSVTGNRASPSPSPVILCKCFVKSCDDAVQTTTHQTSTSSNKPFSSPAHPQIAGSHRHLSAPLLNRRTVDLEQHITQLQCCSRLTARSSALDLPSLMQQRRGEQCIEEGERMYILRLGALVCVC